jgi:hypothetical protein
VRRVPLLWASRIGVPACSCAEQPTAMKTRQNPEAATWLHASKQWEARPRVRVAVCRSRHCLPGCRVRSQFTSISPISRLSSERQLAYSLALSLLYFGVVEWPHRRVRAGVEVKFLSCTSGSSRSLPGVSQNPVKPISVIPVSGGLRHAFARFHDFRSDRYGNPRR